MYIENEYDKFLDRLDEGKTVHHHSELDWGKGESTASGYSGHLIFEISGTSKDGETVIFRREELVSAIIDIDRLRDKLVEKYAEPLGSTEGKVR